MYMHKQRSNGDEIFCDFHVYYKMTTCFALSPVQLCDFKILKSANRCFTKLILPWTWSSVDTSAPSNTPWPLRLALWELRPFCFSAGFFYLTFAPSKEIWPSFPHNLFVYLIFRCIYVFFRPRSQERHHRTVGPETFRCPKLRPIIGS